MLCKLKAIYSTYYFKLCKNIYIYSEISMQNMKQYTNWKFNNI